MFTAEERIPIVANWQYQDSFENFENILGLFERIWEGSTAFFNFLTLCQIFIMREVIAKNEPKP